jgi:hypothetical protein
MGEEDKPTNPLDVFWEQLGDKKKKYVRSYGSGKRNLQDKKTNAVSDGRTSSNSSKRRG